MSEDTLKGHLKQYFNHDQFKSEVQEAATREIVKREKDVFISMPPGSGKSLCFQLPGVLQENKITVVFSPLLDSINNQLDYLNKLNIKAVSINSKMSSEEQTGVRIEIKTKNSNIKFLYLTPQLAFKEKHLLDHMVKFDKLAYVVVEEAHRVSEMSHEFRSEYLILKDIKLQYPNIPWIAMTATAPPNVVDDIRNKLTLKEPVSEFKMPCFRDNLFYDIIYKNSIDDNYDHLKGFIEKIKNQCKAIDWPCGIIYCRTIDSVYIVANSLTELGIKTVGYHGRLKPEEKVKVQEQWMSGFSPIICATFTSLMGVDKSSVRFVCHWDVPQSLAGYYQESAKAGRDGKPSFCRLYFCSDEFNWNIKDISKTIEYERNIELAGKKMKHFSQMTNYCDSAQCRHKSIAEFFGDDPPECTNECDFCQYPEKIRDKLEYFHELINDSDYSEENNFEDSFLDLTKKLEEKKKESPEKSKFSPTKKPKKDPLKQQPSISIFFMTNKAKIASSTEPVIPGTDFKKLSKSISGNEIKKAKDVNDENKDKRLNNFSGLNTKDPKRPAEHCTTISEKRSKY